jgi:glycosyltransferase involved in cell wall biosynthesis
MPNTSSPKVPQALLFTSWYVGLGGGETDLIALAEAIDRTRYTPHLLLPYDGQLGERWRALDLPVHIIPFRGASTYFIPALWARFPVVSKIRQLLRDENIVAVHSDYHTLPLVLPASKALNIPLMWTCWGWWFAPKFWQKSFFKHIDHIVARSQSIKDGFLGEPPFMPPEAIPLVYSGIDTEKFRPDISADDIRAEANIPADAPLVALIARFQDVKGHDVFQDMVGHVVQAVPNAHFIVAGESIHQVGSENAYKERIMARHQTDSILQKHVHYLGFRDDAERVMNVADVVVCPSDFESWGRVNVEAMACATPVVSTNQGGPSETIRHGETGFLVPPRQPEALAQYVIRLLQNTDERRTMGERGRAWVQEHYSAEATAQAYMNVFEDFTGR